MGIWVRIDPMYTQCVIQREIKQENRPNHEPWLSIILPIDNRFFNYRLNTNSALLYPTQRVAEVNCFCPVRQTVRQSCFFFSITPLKPLNRISWNFVIKNELCLWMRIFTGNLSWNYAPFGLRNWYTTDTVCLRKSSETAQQNFMPVVLNRFSTNVEYVFVSKYYTY